MAGLARLFFSVVIDLYSLSAFLLFFSCNFHAILACIVCVTLLIHKNSLIRFCILALKYLLYNSFIFSSALIISYLFTFFKPNINYFFFIFPIAFWQLMWIKKRELLLSLKNKLIFFIVILFYSIFIVIAIFSLDWIVIF